MTDQHAFQHLLNQQVELLMKLTSTLNEEQETLKNNDYEQLISVVETKQSQLNDIQTLDHTIKQAPNYHELMALDSSKETVEVIEKHLAQCKNMNDINNAIIQQSERAIERLKGALLQNRSKFSMTYDNKGKTQGGTLGKSIKA